MSKNFCLGCAFFERYHGTETGECRISPPVRLPREFSQDATAGNRVRNEEVRWGWPVVKTDQWCGEFRSIQKW